MIDDLPYPEDFLLAQRCLEAEPLAISQLKETYQASLLNYLTHTGATIEQARMLTDELWADCLADRPARAPRLATYSGNAPLQAWLKAVVLNKLLQVKRQEIREGKVIVAEGPVRGPDHPDPHVPPDPTEAPLLEIMRDAVARAFRECAAEDFVLVQLAHTNGLRGRELAHMFACSEATISRSLVRARQGIVESTLRHVRERDPWLELRWEDFIELCGVVSPACFGIE
jgi:DNA-directed RNA polymerase specialized sigma24 family protein